MTHLEQFLAEGGREKLYRYAMHLTGRDHDTANDIVSEVLVWASHSTAYNPECGPYENWVKMKLWSTWKEAFRVLERETHASEVGFYIQNAKDLTTGYEEGEGGTLTPALATTLDAERIHTTHDVQHALGELTPEERDLATWAYIEGMDWREIRTRYMAKYRKFIPEDRRRVSYRLEPVARKLRERLRDYAPDVSMIDRVTLGSMLTGTYGTA